MHIITTHSTIERPLLWRFLWLTLLISCVVNIEPAPFDILCILFVFIALASGVKIPRGLGVALLLWGVFIFFNVVASVLSGFPETGIKPMGIRLFMISIWLLITCLIYENPERVLQTIWSGYTASGLLAITIGALAYYGVMPNPEIYLDNARVRSTFKDPNVYTPFLVPLVLYHLYKIESGEGNNLLIESALLLIISVGLLLGFSRGSWLNLTLALTIYASIRMMTIQTTRQLSRLMLLGGLAFVAGAILIAWLISTNEISAVFKERAVVVQGYDVSERFATQLMAVDAILNNPLGIGVGQADPQFGIVPHNVYLFIFSECGWIAGVAYVAFFVLTAWKGIVFCLRPSKFQLITLVAVSCIISTHLQSFFIDSIHWRHLYVLYGLLWGVVLAEEYREKQQAIKDPPVMPI